MYFPQHPNHKHPQSVVSPYIRNQVSHPYKASCKVIVLCIVVSFQRGNEKPNVYEHVVASVPRILSAVNFFVNAVLIPAVICTLHLFVVVMVSLASHAGGRDFLNQNKNG
jgi:hypothetical protein